MSSRPPGKFVEDFNGLISQLKTYTQFDSTTNTRGELLGDPAAQSVESELYGILNTVGSSSGKYRIPADVGFKIGEGGALEFDETKFRDAYRPTTPQASPPSSHAAARRSTSNIS